jgi:serine/threonine protein kinase
MNHFIWRKQLHKNVFVAFDVQKRQRVILKQFKYINDLEREYKSLQHIKSFAKIDGNSSLIYGNSEKYKIAKTLVLPYTVGFDLFTILSDKLRREKKINEKYIWSILRPMSRCIERLHENNLVHLDIKSENFIITEQKNCQKITLIDYYSIDNFIDNGIRKLQVPCVTKSFNAPEVEIHKSFHKNSDLWSLGICATICSLGYNPYHVEGVNFSNIQNYVKDNMVTKCYSSELIENVVELLHDKPCNRKNKFLL